jgi:polyisoprenoid-binding protein YceI
MTPRPLPLLLLIATLAGLGPAPARAANDSYRIDPVHTRVAFLVSHAGFSNAIGTFAGSHGELAFDPDDWASAKLDVIIPIASLDLGDAEWREKILDATFFDAKKFPEAHFVATHVEKTGDDSAKITGDLTLHGVTRPVTLDAKLNALKRHPLTFKRTAGFSATATLSRKDFGMDAWKSVVADEVKILIEIEASRARSDGDKSEDSDSDNATDTDANKDAEHADPQSH